MKTLYLRTSLLLPIHLVAIYSSAIPFLNETDIRNDDAIFLVNGRPQVKPVFEDLIDEREDGELFSDLLPDDQIQDLSKISDNPDDRYRRYALDVPWKTWTNGVIPYEFASHLDNTTIDGIKSIMSVIESWTHFRFVPWNSSVPEVYGLHHENYLIFIRSSSCWSYVGNIRGLKGQNIACCTGVSCLHELGHAIGLHHEHSNPLRDRYIRVNYNNIKDRMIPWFKTRQGSSDRGFGYFDLSSVMAYPRTTFSKNKRDVITVYDSEMAYLLDHKDSTGYYMFYEAQTLYDMKGQKCADNTMGCDNGGYLSFIDGRCQCRCPSGLDPDTGCSTVVSVKSNISCGEVVHLTRSVSTVDIKTPGYPALTTGKQSCTWFIKGPTNSQIALDFHDFDIQSETETSYKCDGHLEIRHLMPGQPGKTYCGYGFKKTVVSEENTLSLLLRTSNPAKFNATIRLISDLCYTNGGLDDSYGGTLNITEDFQTCLHWDKVEHCRMNAFNVEHMDLVENYCRNPGYGSRPWCYVDADNCDRAYCDVCQIRRCYDLFDNCDNTISDPQFCINDPEASRGCRKTCGFCDLQQTELYELQCGAPPSLPDGDIISNNNVYTRYKVGDRVTYRCRTNSSITGNITCTTTGKWSYIAYVCPDSSVCADQRLDCIQLLERNPRLCLNKTDFVKQKCAKTCGVCGKEPNTYCRDYSFTFHSVDLTPRYAKPGEVISKACKTGYQLSSGDLHRACKPDSTLTGHPVICVEDDQMPSTSFHVPLRRRKFTGKENKALIISNEYYTIKRQGEITAWKFYSNYPGRVIFQVWNYDSKYKRFILKGQNVINDTKSDRLVQYNIPKSERIHVNPGQLLGLYYYSSTPGGIPYDQCVTKYDPHGDGVVQIHIAGEIPRIENVYEKWNSVSCRLFSFGAIIGPRQPKPVSIYKWLDLMDFVHDYVEMIKRWSTMFWG